MKVIKNNDNTVSVNFSSLEEAHQIIYRAVMQLMDALNKNPLVPNPRIESFLETARNIMQEIDGLLNK